MIKRDSQNARLLVHLAQGKPLTRYSAILIFRVQNLTARITEMRDLMAKLTDGFTDEFNDHGIEVRIKTDANEQDYAEYRINCLVCRQHLGSYLNKLRRAA